MAEASRFAIVEPHHTSMIDSTSRRQGVVDYERWFGAKKSYI